MSWQIILYNPVTDDVVELLNLERNDGVPDRVFNKVKENSQLDAYYHCVTTDNKVRWGLWSKIPGEWVMPYLIPNQVKLVGVLTE